MVRTAVFPSVGKQNVESQGLFQVGPHCVRKRPESLSQRHVASVTQSALIKRRQIQLQCVSKPVL